MFSQLVSFIWWASQVHALLSKHTWVPQDPVLDPCWYCATSFRNQLFPWPLIAEVPKVVGFHLFQGRILLVVWTCTNSRSVRLGVNLSQPKHLFNEVFLCNQRERIDCGHGPSHFFLFNIAAKHRLCTHSESVFFTTLSQTCQHFCTVTCTSTRATC